ELERQVLQGTLVRELETRFYDYRHCHFHQPAELRNEGGFVCEMSARQLPSPLPEGWRVETLDNGRVRVHATELAVMLDRYREIAVASAGQLPTGFEPGGHYNSRFHPRGLQLAILGASDAVQSLGIDWDVVTAKAGPDNMSVYDRSAMSQLDPPGDDGALPA